MWGRAFRSPVFLQIRNNSDMLESCRTLNFHAKMQLEVATQWWSNSRNWVIKDGVLGGRKCSKKRQRKTT